MTSAEFLNIQNALITVYEPILLFWIILFIFAMVGTAFWLTIFSIAKNKL